MSSVSLTLRSPEETSRAATLLAQRLVPGDVVLLNGPVGAGKTHFARHMIQSILSEPEDVPSPTFTLVQTYDTQRGPLWHSDLYRIASTHEIEELGLAEAFETAICVVEWPDRLGEVAPEDALSLWLQPGADEDTRALTATWADPKWAERTQDWGAS
jgi:tRNA threonylcarbamoyladenosine biosynthesis protein TsaE